MQSPSPEEEQLHAPGHHGGLPAGKQLGRKGLGGPSGQQIEHDPAMCALFQQGWGMVSWTAPDKYCQEVERGDPFF